MNNILRGGVDLGRAVIGGSRIYRWCGGECGGSHHPLLGGTCSTMSMNIVVFVNDTPKDVSKLVYILFFHFVMFLSV